MKFWEKYGISKTVQFFVGVLLLLLIIILGLTLLPSADPAGKYVGDYKPLYFLRMFAALTIGYALCRAAMGFAGTVNRAYNTGSTKLMKSIALLFIFAGIATFIALMSGVITNSNLWTKPISHGLIIGATLFGFGMAFTVCCASGVLTDLAETPLKALTVLLFFCGGTFLGKALMKQKWMSSWIGNGIFGIDALGAANKTNASFTTWFSWDGTNGALGGLILTVILSVLIIYLSNLYEQRRKARNTYIGCGSEMAYEESKNDPKNESLAYRIIAKPWSMTIGALVIAVAFAALLITPFVNGWGVSGPLGMWFARLLHLFGVPTAYITKFAGYSPVQVEGSLLQNPMLVQDLSIFAGALIYMLTSGKFFKPKSWLFNPLEIIFFAFGGIILGLAVNIASGCNAGGLFTPIAEFSLSGWVYLVCIIVGGFLGNMARKYLYKVSKIS